MGGVLYSEILGHHFWEFLSFALYDLHEAFCSILVLFGWGIFNNCNYLETFTVRIWPSDRLVTWGIYSAASPCKDVFPYQTACAMIGMPSDDKWRVATWFSRRWQVVPLTSQLSLKAPGRPWLPRLHDSSASWLLWPSEGDYLELGRTDLLSWTADNALSTNFAGVALSIADKLNIFRSDQYQTPRKNYSSSNWK